jgi:serine/threonine protein kinase
LDFVKVLDFGLVKVVDTDEEARLTQANSIVGTPFYLSPEAVERPDSVTALSDIYAIGGVGYFLLTGTTVFSGKTIMDVCMKHVRAVPEPPSRRLGRPISPSLEAILLQCLAKDPMKRPPSARALMNALARCEPSQPWTEADAESWWSQFNPKAAPDAGLAARVLSQGAPTDASQGVEGVVPNGPPQ